jgi:hypothetical protein
MSSSSSFSFFFRPLTETMAVIAIVSITASVTTNDTVQKLYKDLEICNIPARFVVGTKVQDPSTIQVTSEWTTAQNTGDVKSSPAFASFTDIIHSFSDPSTPLVVTLATLKYSPLSRGAAPFVEYVKTEFLATRATPAYQTQIESDFLRFESLYRKRGDQKSMGELGLSYGWSQEHGGEKNDELKSFVVMRGWESMADFERAV